LAFFRGESSRPSTRSIPPGGVGLELPVGRFAYQGWDLCPTFRDGFVSPRGSSSSGGLGALVLVVLDPLVSDDAF
jgi:hypothetical protein